MTKIRTENSCFSFYRKVATFKAKHYYRRISLGFLIYPVLIDMHCDLSEVYKTHASSKPEKY